MAATTPDADPAQTLAAHVINTGAADVPAVSLMATRRDVLAAAGGGFGLLGLAGLFAEQARGADIASAIRPNPPAKHVIFLFMTGGPSHMDLFDPKPALAKYAGRG